MAEGLRRLRGEALLILSGQDYTAREFIDYSGAHAAWAELLKAGNVSRVDVPGADHTFSTAAWRVEVENETLRWLARVGKAGASERART
jgi:hypothetical protein